MAGVVEARRRPEGRYDRPSPWGQRLLAVFVTLVGGALVAAVFATLWSRSQATTVDGKVLGYTVTSDSSVEIRLEVVKDSGSMAFCIVRSRGADGEEVGRDVVEVDSVGTSSRRAQAVFTLQTSARAITGEIAGCSPQPISKDPDHES